jgi:cytochrome c oxidase subunit 2
MMLRYGEPQVAIGVVFCVLALLIAAVFVVGALQTVRDVPYERVQTVGYWLRKRWLAFLAALLVVVVGISLVNLPYASGARRTVVRVNSGQFFWALDPPEIPADTPVRFDVTSSDVNHGFGIVDPDGHLVGSVQAMPGYHNKLDLTFHNPGVYRVLCLEFCGLDHHAMQATFTVR